MNIFDAASLAGLIDAGKPFEVWWLYADDNQHGHVSLVIGYAPYDGDTLFCVADPLHDQDYWLTADQLKYYDGSMVVTDTLYGIGPKALDFYQLDAGG